MTTEGTMPSYLFVDEDPLQLSAMRRLARDLPGRMRLAHSAEEALQLAEAEAPTVLITSYHLPGMDGLGLLDAIRKVAPAVALALHTARPPLRSMLPADVTVLLKPCPPEKIRAFLTSAHTGQPATLE
jgi:CheY-like chemotaxis protein